MKKNSILCPATITLGLIGSKWKAHILALISQSPEGIRFGELTRLVPGINKRMLTQSLTELVEDDFLIRTEYPEIPPKVVYTLGELGLKIQPVILSLAVFGLDYMREYKEKLVDNFDRSAIDQQLELADKSILLHN